MLIDFEALRHDIIDYFGTAYTSIAPQACIELSEVQTASNERLLELAQELNLNLDNYILEMKED